MAAELGGSPGELDRGGVPAPPIAAEFALLDDDDDAEEAEAAATAAGGRVICCAIGTENSDDEVEGDATADEVGLALEAEDDDDDDESGTTTLAGFLFAF